MTKAEQEIEIKRMLDLITPMTTGDATTGTVTIGERDSAFKTCLPENLTMEIVKSVDDTRGCFVVATHQATSNEGFKLFQSNANLTNVTSDISAGGNQSVEHNFTKHKSGTIKTGDTSTEYDVYMGSRVVYNTNLDNNTGALKKSIQDSKAKGFEMFGAKK